MRHPGLALATATLTAGALLVGCGSATDDTPEEPTTADPAAGSTVSADEIEPVADWLAGEVADNGFVEGPYIDHGLTLDFATTLDELGGHDRTVTRILDAMQDPREIEGYVSFYDEAENGQYAGATAKLVHAVLTADRDVADYREDLVDDLEAMVVTSGAEAGRAKDTGATDYSNAISQAFVVRALAATDSEEPLDESLQFLLMQQCEEGWFRESLSAGRGGEHTCDDATKSDRTPSVDATAHAVTALLEVRDGLDEELQQASDAAIESAVAWLEEVQDPEGAFSVSGSVDDPANANSTGLAVDALAAAGRSEAATEGAQWLLDQSVPSSGPLADEAGAIPFDEQTWTKARKNGIKAAERPQWQRATVEAAQGLQAVAQE